MTGNAVLDETGPLSTSQPLHLAHYGGARTATRGTVARLSQSAADLHSAFARAGHNVWTSTPTNRTEVEYIVLNPVTAKQLTYRVIDAARVIGGYMDTTRYLLQDDPHP